jgi:nitroreductase
MPDSVTSVILMQCTRILKEAFEGPPGPWSYFTDRSPEAGLLGTIDRLTAAAASRPSGSGRSTIAGHVQHLVASLSLSVRWMQGQPIARDRTQSWTVYVVDDAAWVKLRQELRRAYESLYIAIETERDWDEDALGGAMGAIAHAAYHLGAIRQRLALEGVTSRPS